MLPVKAGRGTEVNSHPIREESGVLETAVESDREEVKTFQPIPVSNEECVPLV